MEQDEYDDIFLYLKETKYFWNTITKDVGDYLKCCEECQRNNKKTKTSVSEMTPVPVPERVWEKIGIDLIGPFLNSKKKPLSANGYRYVLTCVDYTSKWPEAFPIYSKSTAEVGSKLYSTICRQAVLPNETLDNYVENVGDEAVENSAENIISNLEVVRQEVGEKLKQNVDKAQKRQKEAYDRRHNVDTKSYEIGQYVLLKNFRRKAGMATIEQRKYIGPYKIIQYKGKGNFVLWNNEQSKTVGPHNQKNFKLWISNPESENNDNTGDDEQDNQTGDDQTGNSTEQDEEDVDCEDAGGEDKDDSVFLTQNKFMEENDETTDDNAVASNFNLSQSSINSESEVERQVERKS
ncbi:unnamed protein product [Mytilus edulis]|uniref:Integrase zinc-binding domain-containing protein n=1 Tax=Mytilus edulis TaxID=6550 RepID=A0A8S3TNU7_MYTED|nr:unnamed protein product [Mytilus edulis]